MTDIKRTKNGTPIRAIEPDDMTPGVEYHFVEINIPGKLHRWSIYETKEERDHIAQEYADEGNKVMKYTPSKSIQVGVNKGNCCSSFVGKWRIMKEVKKQEEIKPSDLIDYPDGVRPLK